MNRKKNNNNNNYHTPCVSSRLLDKHFRFHELIYLMLIIYTLSASRYLLNSNVIKQPSLRNVQLKPSIYSTQRTYTSLPIKKKRCNKSLISAYSIRFIRSWRDHHQSDRWIRFLFFINSSLPRANDKDQAWKIGDRISAARFCGSREYSNLLTPGITIDPYENKRTQDLPATYKKKMAKIRDRYTCANYNRWGVSREWAWLASKSERERPHKLQQIHRHIGELAAICNQTDIYTYSEAAEAYSAER